MSIRRNCRIKSLQYIYAQYLSKINCKKVEENMLNSIKDLNNLYIYLLYLIINVRKEILNNNDKILSRKNDLLCFLHNPIIKIISKNSYLIKKFNIKQKLFSENNEYIIFLSKKIKESSHNLRISNLKNNKKFVINYYNEYFVLNEFLHNHIEDYYGTENLFIAHDIVCETFQVIEKKQNFHFYNFMDNNKFIIYLYRNTILHQAEFNNLIKHVSYNWSIERISYIDLLLLHMAICEFLYFRNIPPKVTINEYIEISKTFCMEKSRFFINGILDKIFKFLRKKNLINK